MVGCRLVFEILKIGMLGGNFVDVLIVFDVVFVDFFLIDRVQVIVQFGDVLDCVIVDGLIVQCFDVIFYFVVIVLGEVEVDFDKGYVINFDGMCYIFEVICVQVDYYLCVVYILFIVVFGVLFEEKIIDIFIIVLMISYGVQKMIGELLLNDYFCKGIFDGIGIWLLMIVVCLGKLNKVVLGFFLGIICELLVGLDVELLVDDDVCYWFVSLDVVVGFLLYVVIMDIVLFGVWCCLIMLGLLLIIVEVLVVLCEVLGDGVVVYVRCVLNDIICGIVVGWLCDFDLVWVLLVGFKVDVDFLFIICVYICDMVNV